MIHIGNHLSSSGGFLSMGQAALRLHADTFAFFTRNPRGGRAKHLDKEDAASLGALLREKGFGPLVAHAPYTLNLCSDDERVRTFARETMQDDLSRMEALPGQYYNFHPGSHVGQGVETGIGFIAEALRGFLTDDMHTTVLLETMAGKGSEIGSSFEELKEILDRSGGHPKLGICLDTCHVWDAGYDIAEDLDRVLETFDRVIGLDRLKAVHLNDSINPCGARKDRHEKLGQGRIGERALRAVVKHPLLQGLPFILETPNDDAGYAAEIAAVRYWMAN